MSAPQAPDALPRRPQWEAVRAALREIDAYTPAAAFEHLTLRGLLPDAWIADPTRRWWCSICGGTGWAYDATCVSPTKVRLRSPDPVPCFCVGETPQAPNFVAWASLGADAIRAAEAQAREALQRMRAVYRRLKLPVARTCVEDAPVVWRVTEVHTEEIPPSWQCERLLATLPEPAMDAWSDAFVEASVEPARFVPWRAHVAAWPASFPPCPYEPLIKLLESGLGTGGIVQNSIVLHCPPLDETM